MAKTASKIGFTSVMDFEGVSLPLTHSTVQTLLLELSNTPDSCEIPDLL